MINVKASTSKMQGYALVRDHQGKPKIDDPMNLPKPIFDMLTEEEKEEIYHGTYPCYDNS
jgi:hypothetical protein